MQSGYNQAGGRRFNADCNTLVASPLLRGCCEVRFESPYRHLFKKKKYEVYVTFVSVVTFRKG